MRRNRPFAKTVFKNVFKVKTGFFEVEKTERLYREYWDKSISIARLKLMELKLALENRRTTK